MDATHSFCLNHSAELHSKRDKLLKLAEVDGSTNSDNKARKTKSTRGFFNGFSSPKMKATPTQSLDLSFTENIEHLARKDSGKGSSVSSRTSDEHSEALSTLSSQPLDLDLAALRLSPKSSEFCSRIPQALDRRASRKSSVKEVKTNNATTRCLSANEMCQAATTHKHSHIPIYKPSNTISPKLSDSSVKLDTRIPRADVSATNRFSAFHRSPSMPSHNAFNDSSENVLNLAAKEMKRNQTRLPSSLASEDTIHLFNERRQAMLDKMAERRRVFLKTRTFEPTTDAFLRKFNDQMEQRFTDAFMLPHKSRLDFDRLLSAQRNAFAMFDEEGMFPNTPRKIVQPFVVNEIIPTMTKPFDLFSTPDQRQYESAMLKNSQKQTLEEMKDLRQQDVGDNMTKSASFDSIEWMGQPQPQPQPPPPPPATSTKRDSGNALSGVSHLEEENDVQEEVGQGLFNRFRKSYSHYFTRQATCPNIKVNRAASLSSTEPADSEDVNRNKIVLTENNSNSSPFKKSGLDLSPPTDNHLGIGKFERHQQRSASSRFESTLGARKSYRRQSRKSFKMKRSHSQPMDDETIAKTVEMTMTTSKTSAGTLPNSPTHQGREDVEDDEEYDEDDFDDAREITDEVIVAEAIWDYFSNDPEELSFYAGDLIDVSDTSNKEWWWGATKEVKAGEECIQYGWIPASYVRLRVNQEETIEEILEGEPQAHKSNEASGLESILTVSMNSPEKRMSMSRISNEQVRANVVLEIINTERVFVKNLKDVIDGYLKPSRDRADMFDESRIQTIFCNIEELYRFQLNFLIQLESVIAWKQLAASQVGNVFLHNEPGFAVYCEFCKNHPLAISELQDLYTEHRYVVFFEGCRLLQNMIDISLDGFLLTPIQKICKYPLQLGELLKYTRADHPDHAPLVAANAAMQRVAQLVNERKRRFEALEQLISLQEVFEGWEGELLIDCCSLLVRSGEVARLTSASSWSAKEVSLFLFDRVLVMAKKRENGLLRKVDTFCFKSRLNANHLELVSAVDETTKDSTFNFAVKNGFKFYCQSKAKWYLFQTKTLEERDAWLRAFHERAERVKEDEASGFVVSDQDRKGAKMAHANRRKPKKPRGRRPRTAKCKKPDTVVAEIPLPPMPIGEKGGNNLTAFDRMSRAGSLPSYIMQDKMPALQQSTTAALAFGHRSGSTLNKKTRSNWFYLSGKSKKNRLKRTLK